MKPILNSVVQQPNCISWMHNSFLAFSCVKVVLCRQLSVGELLRVYEMLKESLICHIFNFFDASAREDDGDDG